MKHVVITLPPLLLFLVVVVAGARWTAEPSHLLLADARALDTERTHEALRVAEAAPVRAAPTTSTTDARVPPHLAAPLKAVAADISLCISPHLARDRGPIDVDVVFTPLAGGAFAKGTRVFTTWHDETVEDCIAEVFDETTFLPTAGERFERSEFVFRFPDDARAGLLGLSDSPFR
jgi:hypothetical protein